MKDQSRRDFMKAALSASAVAALPAEALAQTEPPGTISNDVVKADKAKSMQWHSERPLTGSVPAHEHDFDVTPSDRMFVRNNLTTPLIDINAHRLRITGLVEKELEWPVFDLAKQFRTVSMRGMLECAGSGRSAFNPRASGTPWLETGGMGCPMWGGVRLSDILKAAGLKPGGAHVAGHGGDPGLVPTAAPVIRSIPLAKAMNDATLVAWAMNGGPLPWVHGYPLRLVVPGWVGSASTKWLHTLMVLDAPYKGTYMTSSYIMPRTPVAPGEKMPPDTVSTEAWPIKSIITSPAPNARIKGRVLVRGRAWVGEGRAERAELSRPDPLHPYAGAPSPTSTARSARATSRSSRAPGTIAATRSPRWRSGIRWGISGTAGTASGSSLRPSLIAALPVLGSRRPDAVQHGELLERADRRDHRTIRPLRR